MFKKVIYPYIIFLTAVLASANASDLPYKEGELLIRFAPKANGIQKTADERNQILSSFNAGAVKKSVRLVPGLSVVKLPANLTVADAIQKLQAKSEVLYVEPNYKIKLLSTIPNDTYFNDLWGMHNTGQTGGAEDADIDAPQAWDIATDSDIIVAVIDTGIDYTHPDLAANMWVNQAELYGISGIDDDDNDYVDDIYGYDFSGYDIDDQDSNPMDDHFHGTHVAGIIGAVGNNGTGVTGICWNVKIMALKISPPYNLSEWEAFASNAIEAIDYAVDNGAKVMNASWGIGNNYSQALKDSIENAGSAGVLFIAGAGNEGDDNDTYPLYPASYTLNNIISVMATDHDDYMSYFSNYGLTSVDLGAPGSDILSTFPTYTTTVMYVNGLSTDYETISGTSMAAPHVAGACALVWSANPMLSHLEVRDIILNTADPLPALDGRCVTGGRLNLYNAIASVSNPPICKVDNINDGSCLWPNDYITYTISYANPITDPCNPLTINDVNIIDELPDEVDFDSASGNYQLDANTIIWNIGTLEPNESGFVTLTVQVKSSIQLGGVITNCSLMTGDQIDNVSDCENTPVCCGIVPDLTDEYICDAIPIIEDINGITYGTSIYQYSDIVATDYVINQSATGGVIWGTVIDLVVATDEFIDPESDLLRNNSFESPNPCSQTVPEPAYWQFWENGNPDDSNICYITPAHPDWYAAEPAKHGDDYVQLRLKSVAEQGIDQTFVTQRQYVAEGISYKAEAWARSWDTGANAVIKIDFIDKNGNILRQNTNTVPLSPPSVAEWTAIAVNSNGPAPVGTRTASVSVANLTPDTWVDYDLITLVHTEAEGLTDCQLAQFNWDFEFFAGDFNRDCTVDMHDYSQLADQWLNESIGLTADIAPVPNGDGVVDFYDLIAFAENWLWLWTPDGIQERMLAGGGGMEDLYFASSSSQSAPVQTPTVVEVEVDIDALLQWLDELWLTDELDEIMTEQEYLEFRDSITQPPF